MRSLTLTDCHTPKNDCCAKPSPCSSDKPASTSCCEIESNSTTSACCDSDSTKIDYVFWGAFFLVGLFYISNLIFPNLGESFTTLTQAVYELLNTMALGLAVGILMVAILSYVPREFVISILGTNTGFKGLFRATLAGLLLDLCSHGILMVGAKLYERGVSTGQVMAFLIASPWNSLSLTIILVALIGLSWTLIFIVLSVVVALITGFIFEFLVRAKKLPANPNTVTLPEDFNFRTEMRKEFKKIKFQKSSIWNFILTGIRESKMVIKWLFIGIILAAFIRTFVPEDYFGTYFGPTFLGLCVTLLAATIIEVCSEGSTPIAADIFNRASAPGNGFAFLMTGVSTDYTEIMVLKDTTKSWKIALFLPLITLPQIVVLAMILNIQ